MRMSAPLCRSCTSESCSLLYLPTGKTTFCVTRDGEKERREKETETNTNREREKPCACQMVKARRSDKIDLQKASYNLTCFAW